MNQNSCTAAIASLAVVAMAGCTQFGPIPNPFGLGNGVVHVEAIAKAGGSVITRAGQPVRVALAEVGDARKGVPTRKIGDIRATVIDMATTSLTLDEDVVAVLGKALGSQLAADGLNIIGDPRQPHDFDIEVVAKDFRLDIVDRDELNIVATIAVRDAASKDVIWSADVAEKSSRFAGVAGNSRTTIEANLSKGLGAWAGKASGGIRDGLLRSYPRTMAVTERKDSTVPRVDGITTRLEAKPQDDTTVAVAATAPAAATVAAPNGGAANGKGTFSITSLPTKGKVYIGDVYFGTSPLKLELDPGVIAVRLKLDGYKSVDEKVSIRRGETTELEVKFER